MKSKIFLTFSVVLFSFIITMSSCSSHKTNNGNVCDSDSIDHFIDSLQSEVDSIDKVWESKCATSGKWKTYSEKDDMDDSMSYWHKIMSDNYANFSFPYNDGSTHLYIICRYMKKYGYDVLIQTDNGQMNGSEYCGTNYIRVRFDGGKAKKWYFSESNDGSSDVVFLNKPKEFIKECQKAKVIVIEQEFYQEGLQTFKFHADEPLTQNIKSVPNA